MAKGKGSALNSDRRPSQEDIASMVFVKKLNSPRTKNAGIIHVNLMNTSLKIHQQPLTA